MPTVTLQQRAINLRDRISSTLYSARVAAGVGLNRVGLPSPYPNTLEELMTRPDWLTGTLRLAGLIPFGARVDEVVVEPFRRDESLKSSMGRARVTWSSAGDEEPQEVEVIAKFAPVGSNLSAEMVYTWQRVNEREVAFYTELASLVPIRTPRCHYARATAFTGQMCLLLEPIADAHEVDESVGASAEEAEAVIDAMATLHAHFWGVDRGEVSERWPRTHAPLGGHSYQPFVMDSLVWPEAPEAFHTIWRKTWRAAIEGPMTLIHGDLRVGNVLFVANQDPVLIDWQASRLAHGTLDLAFFLTLSVSPELRRARQDAWVARYHERLLACGVEGYSRELLDRDFRLHQLYTLLLLALPQLSKEVNVNDENNEMATRIADAWRDRLRAFCDEIDHEWVASFAGVSVDDSREVLAFRDERDGVTS